MAITASHRGFTLLIALIFMSVMLSFGLGLGALSYKQQTLVASAVDSQYAFYAADTGLECLLYTDQRLNAFDYASHDLSHPPANITCAGAVGSTVSYTYNASRLVMQQRVSLDGGTACADLMVSKSATQTQLYAQGYSASCTSVENGTATRFASRGISAYY